MKLSLFLLGLVAMSCTVQVARAQIMCTVCEFIVGEVEKYLETNSTDYEILGELVKACDLLTDPSWISMCKTFVDQEGPKLISHIIAGEPPATVCSYVDLCNSSAAFAHPPKVVSAAKAKSGDDVLCGVCTFIVGDVESYLDTNTSESDILSFLEKDCNILGIKSWITTCQGVVATFGPEIIKLVLDKQPADVVCSEIGLCNSSAATKAKVSAASPKITIPIAGAHVPAVPVAPLSVNGTLVCEVCEVLVNFTEKLVDSNKTETEIINALNDVCILIPIKDLSNTCSGMVAEYGKTIIDYLINEEPAAVVCNELKLCNNQSSSKQCLAPGKC